MLLFADMDNLKQVNDRFGHKNGDYAIKSIAQILQQSFDTDDVIGRIGGDEFVAFCFLDDPHTPDHLCSKIKRSPNISTRRTESRIMSISVWVFLPSSVTRH